MALPRLLAAVAVSALLVVGAARADAIGDIDAQYRQGDLASALDAADRYLATNPANARVRFLKALILADRGERDAAAAILTALNDEYPELPEPYNNLAVLHAAAGHYESARIALEAALRANPGYANAHENLGDVHARLALAEYEEALALDAENAAAREKLALMKSLLEKQTILGPAADPSLTMPASHR
ncbi:MAG TPA: tetratricopeptide repeat protein [Thiobacillaceae bacterium]|nr:tetratricopeptide repeat protein [Thiobacillaceae bacterium]